MNAMSNTGIMLPKVMLPPWGKWYNLSIFNIVANANAIPIRAISSGVNFIFFALANAISSKIHPNKVIMDIGLARISWMFLGEILEKFRKLFDPIIKNWHKKNLLNCARRLSTK